MMKYLNGTGRFEGIVDKKGWSRLCYSSHHEDCSKQDCTCPHHTDDICKNCKHLKSLHHAKPSKKNPSVCYGIGCMCENVFEELQV